MAWKGSGWGATKGKGKSEASQIRNYGSALVAKQSKTFINEPTSGLIIKCHKNKRGFLQSKTFAFTEEKMLKNYWMKILPISCFLVLFY